MRVALVLLLLASPALASPPVPVVAAKDVPRPRAVLLLPPAALPTPAATQATDAAPKPLPLCQPSEEPAALLRVLIGIGSAVGVGVSAIGAFVGLDRAGVLAVR